MISASIVVYHTPYNQLTDLTKCAYQNNIDKVYIIDHSSNTFLSKISSDFPEVEYIHRENTGYGGGHNVAIRKSLEDSFDYHIVLNPDILFSSGTITALIKYMEENPNTGLTTPKIINPDGSTRYICRLLPSPKDFLLRLLPVGKLKQKRKVNYELRHTDYQTTIKVPFISGCFMMFRLTAIKKIGLFDEKFFMYCEDIDISRRMANDFDNIMLPAVSAIHAANKESHKNIRLAIVHIKSLIYYFNKWGWINDKDRMKINETALAYVNAQIGRKTAVTNDQPNCCN